MADNLLVLHTFCSLGTTTSPPQLINHYSMLLQQLDPLEVVELMMSHHLLCELDHKIILEAPLDHIKNCYILEHVRHMEASDVLKFIDILKEIPDQKHLWITLTDGETLQSVKYYCPLHTYVHICIMGSSVRQVNKAFDYLSIIIFSIIVIVILWLLQ